MSLLVVLAEVRVLSLDVVAVIGRVNEPLSGGFALLVGREFIVLFDITLLLAVDNEGVVLVIVGAGLVTSFVVMLLIAAVGVVVVRGVVRAVLAAVIGVLVAAVVAGRGVALLVGVVWLLLEVGSVVDKMVALTFCRLDV